MAYAAGVDVGSTQTKAAIVDEDRNLVARALIDTGSNVVAAAENVFEKALKEFGIANEEVEYVIGTGYGRYRVTFGNDQVTEISCHGRGAVHMFPNTRTVVDMGGGATTIAVFYDGHVVHADTIAIGGGHVTSDIARGLSTPLADAERMKTLYGSAIPSPEDEREVIDVPLVGEDKPAQPNHVPRSLLVGIIRPRLEETFELVRSRLEAKGLDRLAGRRLVLTGGASQLRGARELASLIMEKQVRLGRPLRLSGLAEATSGPAFATCAGLLRYAAERHGDHDGARRTMTDPGSGRFGRIGHWLRESF